MIDNGNFSSRFIHNAQQQPDKLALHIPQMERQICVKEESITYGELAKLVGAYQILWQEKGFKAGDRIIVILQPNKDLYAIALSLFSLGIVPVFIDTGMGRKRIQMAIRDSNAKAIISMAQLIKLFWFIPSLWSLQRYAIDGSGLGYKNISLQVTNMKKAMGEQGRLQWGLTYIARNETDHGLISFTSGSTGRPKGADRTHFSLIQQHLAIRDHWPDEADDVDCPCFPVMVLHNLSCGMTTIMPKVDLAQPSEVNAALVIEQIRQHKITRLSGAPAYINALVDYLNLQPEPFNCVQEVKSLVVGGATVSKSLARGIKQAFPMADGKIVYGSTEAEPISEISIDEYLAENDSASKNSVNNNSGYLVGYIASQVELLIVKSAELNQEKMTETELILHSCKQGEIGEILVSGHHVLKQYIDNPEANRENKIPRDHVEQTKSVWHRTGDCGYQDDQGRLWLSGRVKDTLQLSNQAFQPYPLEQKLELINAIQRSAVIENKGCVYVFIQCEKSNVNHLLKEHLSSIVNDYFLSIGQVSFTCIGIDKIPVDGRHNSKIDRPLLRERLENNKLKGCQIIAL